MGRRRRWDDDWMDLFAPAAGGDHARSPHAAGAADDLRNRCGCRLPLEKDGDRFAVQCKQWRTWNVGVKAVREFLGAMTDAGIQKGIFITLCGYTGEAKVLADKHGIEIVNETGVARMLESTGARFDPETLAILQDARKFCPRCESEMVLRTASKGLGAGKQFWGCSAYPRCRFTMPKE